jgi:hypothetical protein
MKKNNTAQPKNTFPISNEANLQGQDEIQYWCLLRFFRC